MELIENLSTLENLSANNHDHHDHIMVFSGDSFSDQQQRQQVHHHHHHLLPMNLITENIQSFSHSDNHEDPRTVLLDHSMLLSSDQSGSSRIKKEKRLGGRKRKRNNEKVVEKPKEVIHVRAKRGQATDNHSLAERVRREKINERLKSLQNLVPGCYKTMGMAVMLDVVISYVQSLQSQIEFLSMKLSAASMYYDFNSPNMDALETVPGTNIAYEEVQEMEKMMMMMMMREGYGGLSYLHSSTLPL